MVGIPAVLSGMEEKERQKEAARQEKKNDDAVCRLLVNTDLSHERIAEVTKTSLEYVQDKKKNLRD